MRAFCLAAALALGACGPTAVVGTAIDGLTYARTGKGLTHHAIDFLDERTCLVEYLRDGEPREGCGRESVRPMDDPAMERPNLAAARR